MSDEQGPFFSVFDGPDVFDDLVQRARWWVYHRVESSNGSTIEHLAAVYNSRDDADRHVAEHPRTEVRENLHWDRPR